MNRKTDPEIIQFNDEIQSLTTLYSKWKYKARDAVLDNRKSKFDQRGWLTEKFQKFLNGKNISFETITIQGYGGAGKSRVLWELFEYAKDFGSKVASFYWIGAEWHNEFRIKESLKEWSRKEQLRSKSFLWRAIMQVGLGIMNIVVAILTMLSFFKPFNWHIELSHWRYVLVAIFPFLLISLILGFLKERHAKENWRAYMKHEDASDDEEPGNTVERMAGRFRKHRPILIVIDDFDCFSARAVETIDLLRDELSKTRRIMMVISLYPWKHGGSLRNPYREVAPKIGKFVEKSKHHIKLDPLRKDEIEVLLDGKAGACRAVLNDLWNKRLIDDARPDLAMRFIGYIENMAWLYQNSANQWILTKDFSFEAAWTAYCSDDYQRAEKIIEDFENYLHRRKIDDISVFKVLLGYLLCFADFEFSLLLLAKVMNSLTSEIEKKLSIIESAGLIRKEELLGGFRFRNVKIACLLYLHWSTYRRKRGLFYKKLLQSYLNMNDHIHYIPADFMALYADPCDESVEVLMRYGNRDIKMGYLDSAKQYLKKAAGDLESLITIKKSWISTQLDYTSKGLPELPKWKKWSIRRQVAELCIIHGDWHRAQEEMKLQSRFLKNVESLKIVLDEMLAQERARYRLTMSKLGFYTGGRFGYTIKDLPSRLSGLQNAFENDFSSERAESLIMFTIFSKFRHRGYGIHSYRYPIQPADKQWNDLLQYHNTDTIEKLSTLIQGIKLLAECDESDRLSKNLDLANRTVKECEAYETATSRGQYHRLAAEVYCKNAHEVLKILIMCKNLTFSNSDASINTKSVDMIDSWLKLLYDRANKWSSEDSEVLSNLQKMNTDICESIYNYIEANVSRKKPTETLDLFYTYIRNIFNLLVSHCLQEISYAEIVNSSINPFLINSIECTFIKGEIARLRYRWAANDPLAHSFEAQNLENECASCWNHILDNYADRDCMVHPFLVLDMLNTLYEYYYYEKPNTYKAVKYLEMLVFLEEVLDVTRLHHGFHAFDLAMIYYNCFKSQLEKAIEYYIKSRNAYIFAKSQSAIRDQYGEELDWSLIKIDIGLALAHLQIGRVKMAKEDCEHARRKLRRFKENKKSLKTELDYVEALVLMKEDPRRALNLLNDALDRFCKMNNYFYTMECLNRIVTLLNSVQMIVDKQVRHAFRSLCDLVTMYLVYREYYHDLCLVRMPDMRDLHSDIAQVFRTFPEEIDHPLTLVLGDCARLVAWIIKMQPGKKMRIYIAYFAFHSFIWYYSLGEYAKALEVNKDFDLVSQLQELMEMKALTFLKRKIKEVRTKINDHDIREVAMLTGAHMMEEKLGVKQNNMSKKKRLFEAVQKLHISDEEAVVIIDSLRDWWKPLRGGFDNPDQLIDEFDVQLMDFLHYAYRKINDNEMAARCGWESAILKLTYTYRNLLALGDHYTQTRKRDDACWAYRVVHEQNAFPESKHVKSDKLVHLEQIALDRLNQLGKI